MSHPPRFVSPEDSVAQAMVLCQRHHQGGIQVGDENRLEGIVMRERLDEAIKHGPSHAPVKSVMNPAETTCEEDTPLPELVRLVVGSEKTGRVPVLRGGKVVGVERQKVPAGPTGRVGALGQIASGWKSS